MGLRLLREFIISQKRQDWILCCGMQICDTIARDGVAITKYQSARQNISQSNGW